MGLFCPFLIDLIHNKRLKCVGFAFAFTPERLPNGPSSFICFPSLCPSVPQFPERQQRSAHHR